MRDINKIIIHCSDSEWGDVDDIDQWHKQRGWDGIGYHYLITNGRLKNSREYQQEQDGKVQSGRPLDKIGAHCKGENRDSIGICLIGKHHFTSLQLFNALPDLLLCLMDEHDLSINDIYGHYEFNHNKTCPNFNVFSLKTYVQYMNILEMAE